MAVRSEAELLGEDEPEARQPDAALPETIKAADLARLLGLSANRVSVLGSEGVLKRRTKGTYELAPSVAAYVEWCRDNPRGRKRAASDERERLAREQADKIALQNARARGELLDAAEVARRWVEYTTALRAALLAVPARVAAQTGLERPAAAALDAELRAALDQIADSGRDNQAEAAE